MGRLLYHGPTSSMASWFQGLGYEWNPDSQGTVSDWALDLVSISFGKARKVGGSLLLPSGLSALAWNVLTGLGVTWFDENYNKYHTKQKLNY